MIEQRREPDDIGCLEAIEMFYAFLDGELGDHGSLAEFEHHLAHCRSCFSRAEFEKLLTARLRVVATEPVPDVFRARLRKLMEGF